MLGKFKVAFQGMVGAYSQKAIYDLGKKFEIEFDPEPKHDFRDLFEAIDKETYLGLVPIENSTAGSVTPSYDLFFDYDFEILAEYDLLVEHCLLGIDGVDLNNVEKIISHPQALAQCSDFIETKKWKAISVFDTAGSAMMLSKDRNLDTVAIASEIAAEKYGLKILERGFQNNKNNYTRFLLVKKKEKKFEFEEKLFGENAEYKSTVMFETKNIPAALYKCLGGFATNGINLTKIESRPKKYGKKFEPIFYVNFDGHNNENNVKLAMDELKYFSKEIKFLGSYVKHK